MTEDQVAEEPLAEEQAEESADAAVPAAPAPPEETICKHCGQAHTVAPGEGDDWLCPNCEHYQDQTLCPTCKQIARTSLMGQRG